MLFCCGLGGGFLWVVVGVFGVGLLERVEPRGW